jgi:hypothetical protein
MGWEGAVDLTGWKGGYDYKYVKKTSEDDEELRPHLWSKQSSCLTVSCLEWRAKTESDAAWHKLKVTGSKFRSIQLIRFFATASRMAVHNSSEETTSGCKPSLLDIQR